MNIVTRKDPLAYIPFEEVMASQPFFVQEGNFIKTNKHGLALHLETGHLVKFTDADLVTTVDFIQVTQQTTYVN
jgi:hypothetical protein